ncbi:MAG: DUF2027 domain-containing protein [Bacteroidia bacterium]|nr:DUF2027 domain-containing protein [Bacteroidia bacterium]
MKLQAGDQVKYLNAIGGGVVTKVLDSRMVLVADQDGFEMPVLISELVKMDPTDTGGRFFKEEFQTPTAANQEMNFEGEDSSNQDDENEPDYLDPRVIRNRKSEDIFLAFAPHDQKWLITGLMDLYLVNNTSFDIIYNLFHKAAQGNYKGVDYGSLFAGTRHLLATVNRESLSSWTEGSLQFLFHKEQLEEVIPPFNSDFKIDGTKFHKEGAYRESSLINEKGIIIKVLSLTSYLEENRPKSKETREPAPMPIASALKETGPVIFSHQTEPRKAVIDLHIHELIEDPSNLQKAEILEFQKNYFIRCLDAAIGNNFVNVVFIHGVGDGILRGVLIDHLKKTEGIEWFDAPMALYGVGAIEVRIPHNR